MFSCNSESRYVKRDGEWEWKHFHGGNFNFEYQKIDSVNHDRFSIISENYAKDDHNVFYKFSIIKNADLETFEVMERGYSKDKNNIFLDDEMVIFANPQSFKLLEFPYSKDSKRVFCGTIPLKLNENEAKEFSVTNTDKLLSRMKSSTLLSYFIKVNPEYKWLDTLNINGVIYGKGGTGETLNKKFKGFKEIE